VSRVAVGVITAAWGLKGYVKVRPMTSNPQRFAAGSTLFVKGKPRRVLEHVEPYGYPILLLEGFTNRTLSESLRGEVIEIDESELAPLPPGEYYVDDLVGLEVVTAEGDPLGRLAEVLTTGANDVYLVRRPGARDVLIPAIPDVVQSVDLDAKRMTIVPLPGLLEA
jgi:16S rRNA processing protein RimM